MHLPVVRLPAAQRRLGGRNQRAPGATPGGERDAHGGGHGAGDGRGGGERGCGCGRGGGGGGCLWGGGVSVGERRRGDGKGTGYRLLGVDATAVTLRDARGFAVNERDEGGGSAGGASLELGPCGGHALDLAVGDLVACLGGVGDGRDGCGSDGRDGGVEWQRRGPWGGDGRGRGVDWQGGGRVTGCLWGLFSGQWLRRGER